MRTNYCSQWIRTFAVGNMHIFFFLMNGICILYNAHIAVYINLLWTLTIYMLKKFGDYFMILSIKV